jgi:3-O-methylgallate 3,4-dioxygenase
VADTPRGPVAYGRKGEVDSMAEIVLGIGTSHTPVLSLPSELWLDYATRDRTNTELAYPPHGQVLSYEAALERLPQELRGKFTDETPFADQYRRLQSSLDTLAETLQQAAPDVTVIISDDQDEWFFEHTMPRFAIYWGDSVPLIPSHSIPGSPAVAKAIADGYGDVELDVPVAGAFGRHLLDYLLERDFDMAHVAYPPESSGGKVMRRYPTPDGGETQVVRDSAPRRRGLPHGFAFVVKRLYANQPRPILPVFQNTCYPPNTPTPRRSYAFGQAIADGIRAWKEPARVAVIASGGLSHFVVDEVMDRQVLDGLARKDAATLQSVPRERLYSAASEAMNWIALGGVMAETPLEMELLEYVAGYRSPAATGGGWAFARWQ